MFKRFQVSITVSIIAIFVFLLSVIGFTIILINYVTLNKVLRTSAQNLIAETSLLVKDRIQMYLRPLSRDLRVIKNTINRGIVSLDNRKQLDRFLIERIRYNPDIYMIYFGSVQGDFFAVDHEMAQGIGLNHVLNSKIPPESIRYELDEQGKIIREKKISTFYDPRLRPWYQEAVQAQKVIWTDVYTFSPFSENKLPSQGITAAVPIYDKEKILKGVFAIDLTIEGIQHFIDGLQVSQNAMIYITDDKDRTIAYRNPNQKQDIKGKSFRSEVLNKFKISLANLEKKVSKSSVTVYEHHKEEYFLSYQSISNTITAKPWHIIIIVPADDVLAPLHILSIRAIILTFFVLVIGLLIAGAISKRISRPIIQLADEAQEITRLNLNPPPKLNTIIKEISYMDNSLSNMRKSLLSFQRYMPRSLVKKLMCKGEIARVGGKNQEMTLLFSDIKNFTTFCEETKPQLLMLYLSDYFQSMTESVIAHAGTLDKYIGDAVMAFWNAPDKDIHHALHACQTAVDMLKRVEKFNERYRQLGFAEFIIRIGINSGEAIVGNVGSEDRLNYTALGDAVNLASRLESINKLYQSQIIVSKATYQSVEHNFSFRLLDEVAVQGKKHSTTIYELLARTDIEGLETYKKTFEQAFSKYQQGHWAESLRLFKALKPLFPKDHLAMLYIHRCERLIESPPSYWDGVWRID